MVNIIFCYIIYYMDKRMKRTVRERKGNIEPIRLGRVVKIITIWVGLILVSVLTVGISYKMLLPTIYPERMASVERLEFPDFITADVSESVRDLLLLAKNEYENPKPGEFYAGGIREPWCADFVSYLYKEIGHPFSNPNTGYWRIPGIYTLREYLQGVNAWHPEQDYLPQLGDIVVYDGGIFGGHTNIVVEVGEDYIMVMGGNEGNQIRLDKIDWTDKKYGVLGFGHIL